MAESTSSSSSVNNIKRSLRNMVKPFLLKCHPDTQQTEAAKKTNLLAIQNLNSYLDCVETLLQRPPPPSSSNRNHTNTVFDVQFVLPVEEPSFQIKKNRHNKRAAITSKRNVKLMLPQQPQHDPKQSDAAFIHHHVTHELTRLLRMAGLDISDASSVVMDDLNYGTHTGHHQQQERHTFDPWNAVWRDALDLDDIDDTTTNTRTRFERTAYDKSRQRFTARINWKRLDELYEQSMVDLQADLLTEGMIAQHTGRRRAYIADMLSRVTVHEGDDDSIDVVDQVVALRRLSLLLNEHFEKLHLERLGNLWGKCKFVLGAARDFNTSGSALYKRRKRLSSDVNDGFSFTLHPDHSVTIQIPIDFRDDELVEELDRNLGDMYSMIEDELNSILH